MKEKGSLGICLIGCWIAGVKSAQMIKHNAIFANGTHRFLILTSEPSFGRVKPEFEGMGVLPETVGVSQCGTDPTDIVYIGPPPSECQSGKYFDVTPANGYVEMLYVDKLKSTGIVKLRYPGSTPPTGTHTHSFYPFKTCWREPAQSYTGLSCAAQPDISYYISETHSGIWLNDLAPSGLLAVYSTLMVITLALLASNRTVSDSVFRAVAADIAFGGAIFHVYRVCLGQISRGLEVEVGKNMALLLDGGTATCSLIFSGLSWLNSLKKTLNEWPTIGQMPLIPANLIACQRELLELPIIFSLVAMWPGSIGITFIRALGLILGVCAAIVCGRAACIITSANVKLASAPQTSVSVLLLLVLLSGIVCSSTLLLPSVAQSECVARGLPSIVTAVSIAAQLIIGGWAGTSYIYTKRK